VESPSSKDLLDGRTEGRLLWEALQLAGVQVLYNLATDYSTFNIALTAKIMQMSSYLNIGLPILHLSMHGNEDGIGLTNGTRLKWDDLRKLLLPINKLMQGGLIVCMSACSSASGGQMAMYDPPEPLPFFALIGHTGTPSWHEAAIAFVTFYHHLFKHGNIEQAVDAMKVASDNAEFTHVLGKDAQQAWISYMQQKRLEDLRRQLRTLAKGQPE
jgi:hypothetical protein